MVDRSAVVIAHQCTIVMHRLKHRTGDHRLGVIWGPIDILKIDPQLVILVLRGIVHSRNLKTKVEAFQAVVIVLVCRGSNHKLLDDWGKADCIECNPILFRSRHNYPGAVAKLIFHLDIEGQLRW